MHVSFNSEFSQNRPVSWRKLWPWLISGPVAFLVSWLVSFFPQAVEGFYSRCLYRVFAKVLSWIFGWIPISFGEVLLASGLAWVLWQLIHAIQKRLRRERSLCNLIWRGTVHLLTIFSVLVALGYLLWGFNNRRLPIAQLIGLDVQESSTAQLETLCNELVERCNQIREQMTENETGVAKLKNDVADALNRVPNAYELIATRYSFLNASYPAPKAVFFSIFMSYCGIGGVFDPFTGEPNVNVHMPAFEIPATAAHEMAHQHGFAREDEANFIAFLVCRAHPDPDFQYSGHKLALAHSMNQLYLADQAAWKRCAEKRSPAVVRDLQFSRNYWQSFESPARTITTAVNDAYLKSQGQFHGVRSYGRMVDLLLAERNSR